MAKKVKDEGFDHTKYEKARLIGARALQIKMGAPVMIKVPKEATRPLDIARIELEKDTLPITVSRKEEQNGG